MLHSHLTKSKFLVGNCGKRVLFPNASKGTGHVSKWGFHSTQVKNGVKICYYGR